MANIVCFVNYHTKRALISNTIQSLFEKCLPKQIITDLIRFFFVILLFVGQRTTVGEIATAYYLFYSLYTLSKWGRSISLYKQNFFYNDILFIFINNLMINGLDFEPFLAYLKAELQAQVA